MHARSHGRRRLPHCPTAPLLPVSPHHPIQAVLKAAVQGLKVFFVEASPDLAKPKVGWHNKCRQRRWLPCVRACIQGRLCVHLLRREGIHAPPRARTFVLHPTTNTPPPGARDP